MNEAWAITSGSYDDYQVHGIVESEQAGKDIVDELNSKQKYGDYHLESFPVITGIEWDEVLHKKFRAFFRDGVLQIIEGPEWTSTLWRAGESEYKPAQFYKGWDHTSFTVVGTDHDQVRKLYAEKKAELLTRMVGREDV